MMRNIVSWLIHRCCGRFYIASPRAIQTRMDAEHTPLMRVGRASVIATSSAEGKLQKTVHTLLLSDKDEEYQEGISFLRKLFSLLVIQYSTVLFIASPFTLIDSLKTAITPYNELLEILSCIGVFTSFGIALTKGTRYPYAHVAMISLTIFVGFEIGLSFSQKSWGPNGILALGQATSCFAIILSLLQFELPWLTNFLGAFLCLPLACVWAVVQVETGVSWKVAGVVSLCGWIFILQVLFCCKHISKYVAPQEYILGTLFILAPEALICLGSKERHPESSQETKDENIKSTSEA